MASTAVGSVNVITTLSKSDTTWYDPPLEMVYAGGAGAVALTIEGRPTPAIYTLAAQGFLSGLGPIRRVLSTGTAATLLVGIGRGAAATS